MLNPSSGDQSPQPPRGAIVAPARRSRQKAGGEKVASTSGINHALHRARRNRLGLFTRHDQTTLFAAGDHSEPRIVAQPIECAVEIGGLVETVQLALIGAHRVTGAATARMW